MKMFKGEKMWKRIVSVALVIVMVLAILPFDELSMVAKADAVENTYGVFNYLYNTGTTTAKRVRAVLKDLPDTGGMAWDDWVKNVWQKGTRGSVERPFLLLEVVPYYNNSTMGYFVDGCEPVNVEGVTGNQVIVNKLLPYLGNLFEVSEIAGDLFYFADEEEGHSTFYIDQNVDDWSTDPVTKLRFSASDWENKKRTGDANPITLKGYYEVVNAGEGNFVLNVVDGKKYIVDATNDAALKATATLKWHTANPFMIAEWQSEGIDTSNLFKTRENLINHPDLIDLTTYGSRFYTVREASTVDDVYYDLSKASNWGNACLYRVKNKDRFVTDTIGCTEAQAKNYSVWIKTVTPVELNNHPEWVDIADMIYMNRFSDQTEILYYWGVKINGDPVNKLGITGLTNQQANSDRDYKGTYSNIYPSDYVGKPKDFNWTVTKRIVERVASVDDYVGIMFDKAIVQQLDQLSVGTQYRYNLNDEKMAYYDSNGKKVQSVGADGVTSTQMDTSSQGNSSGFISNIGKLYIMVGACNPNIVKKFFIDKNKIGVFSTSDVDNGIYAGYTTYIKNREEGEDRIWNAQTFYVGSELNPTVNTGAVDKNEYWFNYSGSFMVVGDNLYVQGHNYISGSNSNSTLLSDFHSGTVGVDPDWYVSFNNYLKTNQKTKEIWIRNYVEDKKAAGSTKTVAELQAEGTAAYANVDASNVAPWAALRYILDLDNDVNFYYGGNIRILDIEPSVGLSADNAKPDWTFTEEIAEMMLPNFTGTSMNIIIDHQIMSNFVGKITDINSEYDMVFMGEDPNGFWLDDTARPGRTNFTDSSMDGLVYFHMGDYVKIGLTGDAKFTGSDGNMSRQPGNDLTRKKAQELKDYLDADYAIAVSDNLYKTGKGGETDVYVENSSYCVLKSFLDNNKSVKNAETGVYSTGTLKQKTEIGAIDSKVRNKKINDFKIISTPREYKYSDTEATRDATYLDLVGTNAVMPFTIELPAATGYSYKIYIDKNRDAKFVEKPGDVKNNEVVRQGTISGAVYNASTGKYEFTCSTKMSAEAWTGFIQWKIEVFKTDNPKIRVSAQGCSAIPVPAGQEKNQITALLVSPKGNSNENMKTLNRNGTNSNSAYTTLYSKVKDFDITVVEVSWAEFESLFYSAALSATDEEKDSTSYGFYYNVNDQTINDEALQKIEHCTDDTKLEYFNGIELWKFNMLVFGFKDSYDNVDMRNRYGAAEYIYYFARKGDTSILFTHDNTSFYNNPDQDKQGYTASTILREIQGMNRYGVVSTNASLSNRYIRPVFGSQLQSYVTSQGDIYDKIPDSEKVNAQSFTLYTLLCKIGQGVTATTRNGTRSQYRYVANDPESSAQTHYYYNGDCGDLEGEDVYLSITMDGATHYFKNNLVGGENDKRIDREKGGNYNNAAVYRFERVDGTKYRLYTIIGGVKNYVTGTEAADGNHAWMGFTEEMDSATIFNVSKHPNGEYLIAKDGTYFGLNMTSGVGGNGFAMWRSSNDDGSRVTIEFVNETTLPHATVDLCIDISPNQGSYGYANNKNALTDYAKRTNKGQITTYPFEIGENLIVAPTHGQYYQLNMEDPELTVWYTLEDPKTISNVDINGYKVEKTERNLNGSEGFGLMYGITPGNVAENYYIYSKGNIYYSGVGHRGTSNGKNEYERKLFVNVLIAAYRPKVMPPEIELTGSDVSYLSSTSTDNVKYYELMVEREYDYSEADGMSNGITFDEAVCIPFIPRDYCGCGTVRCQVFYSDLSSDEADKYFTIHEVITSGAEKTVGNALSHVAADAGATAEEIAIANTTYELQVDHEYCIEYNKKYITDSLRTKITFESQNDVIEDKGTTKLTIKPLPLFRLD